MNPFLPLMLLFWLCVGIYGFAGCAKTRRGKVFAIILAILTFASPIIVVEVIGQNAGVIVVASYRFGPIRVERVIFPNGSWGLRYVR